MLTKWSDYFKFLITRTVFIYLACSLLIWRLLDYHQLMDNAIPQTMSRLTPPIDYFEEFVDRHGHYDQFNLMDCVNYHKAVADFFVFQKAEAFGMLGFCYERLGQEPQSIAFYQKAIDLNPYYFWPYYNLGSIYYRQAQYAQAEEYFYQAIKQDPIKTFVLLSRSKVYNDVRLSKQIDNYDYLQGLKQGRIEAYILLMDSLYKTEAYPQLWEISMAGIKEGLDAQGIFYYYAGVSAFYQKSYQKAVSLLQIAIEDNSHNAEAYLYMGMCLKIANKPEMAQVFINKGTQLHQQGGSLLEEYLNPQVRFF